MFVTAAASFFSRRRHDVWAHLQAFAGLLRKQRPSKKGDWEFLSLSNVLRCLLERRSLPSESLSCPTVPSSCSFSAEQNDDDLPPKEFEEPETWELQSSHETDDDLPPFEVDEPVPENADHSVLDRDDLSENDWTSVCETDRQPATDILFEHRSICGEQEITTEWRPYMCGAEKRRLGLMARNEDLKPFSNLARREMGRFREKCEGKYSLDDRLPGDKWSAGGRKLQLALRSMVVGASVANVPDEAISFTTIDFAATPELTIWLEAGGGHPNDIFDDAMMRIDAAQKEVGAVHVMRDGISEIAQAVNADEDNERCAVFAKAYAREHWPKGLLWEDHSEKIFVPHIHAVFVLLDKDGRPIPAERFAEALRKQFPLPRAIRVEPPRDSRWAPGASRSEKAAALIRYNLTKERKPTEAEITENIRWHKELQPDHIFFSGWTSYAEARPMAVPIMRASLLARQKLQEALADFDIGVGHRLEAPPETAREAQEGQERVGVVVHLDDYRRQRTSPLSQSKGSNASDWSTTLPSLDIRAGPPLRSGHRVVWRPPRLVANDNHLLADAVLPLLGGVGG